MGVNVLQMLITGGSLQSQLVCSTPEKNWLRHFFSQCLHLTYQAHLILITKTNVISDECSAVVFKWTGWDRISPGGVRYKEAQ